nr:translation initiation factor IF-2 [Actinomycetota bacterium]
MAKRIRVYELAKELGLSNKGAVDLCNDMGIGIKSHSSSIEDAQADRVRRKIARDGIGKYEPAEGRGHGHAEEAPAPRAEAPAAEAAPVERAPVERAPERQPRPVERPAAPAQERRPAPAPSADGRPADAGERRPSGGAPAAPSRPAAPRVVRSSETHAARPAAPEPGAEPPRQAPAAESAPSLDEEALKRRGQGGAPNRPRVPLSLSGKPIPPPPGMTSPRVQGGRPAAGGRPGYAPRQGGFGDRQPRQPGQGYAPRQGGAPSDRQGRPGFGDRQPRQPGQGYAPRQGGAPGQGYAPRQGGAPGQGGFAPRQGGFAPRGGQGGAPGAGAPRGGAPFGARGAGAGAGAGAGGRAPVPPAGGFAGRGAPGGGRGRAPQRPAKRRSRKNMEELEPTQVTSYVPSNAPVPDFEVIIERGSSAQEVGPKLNRSAGDIVRFLLLQGEPVTATQTLSDEAIELFAAELGAKVKLVDPGQQQEAELYAKHFAEDDVVDEEDLEPRAPVVTVMGHVDHGKTKLLDRIRETNVVAKEAGGITQHIGAYRAAVGDRFVTFIDTPGHEAFTAMRARGAQVTDIVVLVVAADDGVMPQTVEAINHAKAAGAPIVVAINKIDRPDADPNRVMQQLSELGLVPEAWGGDTIMVQVSALQNLGVDDLLEHLVILADIMELKSTPRGRAKGVVLEANLDPGRGPVATVLVQKGTLKVGSILIAGPAFGRVKALIDESGKSVNMAEPSTPVQVLGFSEVPSAGDEFREVADLSVARQIGGLREQRIRLAGLSAQAGAAPGAKLEDIFEQIKRGEVATLNVIVKADVQGSLEAVTESLRKQERPEVKLSIIHRAVGGITEY